MGGGQTLHAEHRAMNLHQFDNHQHGLLEGRQKGRWGREG